MGALELRDKLEPILNDYEYILIDCPPSLSSLTSNALVAATDVFIPVQTAFFPLVGIEELLFTINKIKRKVNPNLEVSGVILTMWDKREKIGEESINQVRGMFGDLVFKTVVRINVKLKESPANRQTIFEYAPNSSGAEEYEKLTLEVMNSGR